MYLAGYQELFVVKTNGWKGRMDGSYLVVLDWRLQLWTLVGCSKNTFFCVGKNLTYLTYNRAGRAQTSIFKFCEELDYLWESLQMCIISFLNKKGEKYCFLTITAKSGPRNAVTKTEMSKWVCFCIKERLFIVNLAIKPRSLPALLLCYCYSWTILKRKVARAKGFKKWIVLVWQQWWGLKHEMSHLRRAEMNRGGGK